jgi:hypothetical protein
MKAVSSSQAVWPALVWTYRLLFHPFAWARFLKLAAVAVITEGMLFSFRFTATNAWTPDSSEVDFTRLRAVPGFALYTALAIVGVLLIALLLYLLLTELRFAFFHCLLHDGRELRFGRVLYRAQAQRFFMACLWVWLGLLALVLLAAAGLAVTVFVVFTAKTPEGKLDPGVFLLLFFPCVAVFALGGVVALAAQVVMRDFILPHMALENATFREAWRAVRQRIRVEKETFFSYFILRVGLPLVAGVVLVIAGWLAGLGLFGILGASAAGFNNMLADASGFGEAFNDVVQALFLLLELCAGALLAAVLGGPLGVFIRCFALYFYGSRYQPLGEMFDTSQPPIPSTQEAV